MPTDWTFLSTHGLVFLAVASNPTATQRELADVVGVTERTVQKAIADLVDDGYLIRVREGRRNRYEALREAALRHPLLTRTAQIHDLVALIADEGPEGDPD